MATTAIVGGGFSGALTALNILNLEPRRSPQPRVVLFERSGRPGPGLAYSTRSPVHYLNVPAGNMSAWESDPQHFLRWLCDRNPAASGGSFVSRAWFGDYLHEQVQTALDRHGPRFELAPADVSSIRKIHSGGFEILDSRGTRTCADRVVLALGNFAQPHPPAIEPEALTHPGYIADPWRSQDINSILPDEPIVLIGTGLTMMDVVMQLHAREHAGRITAISRHGLLPRPHRSPARPPAGRPVPAALLSAPLTARGSLRALRAAVQQEAARGVDWREVVASLRPITPRIWQDLGPREQARFLQRLRSYWEVVRHRAAPESAAAVSDLVAARHLSIRAGRIVRIRPDGATLEVTFIPRRSRNPQAVRASRLINCLGPQSDIRRVAEPLVVQMLADGLISPDPLNLGIRTSGAGEAIACSGEADPGLLVVGPARKGAEWESTAVPELRRQAAEVARRCVPDSTGATPACPPENARCVIPTTAPPTSPR